MAFLAATAVFFALQVLPGDPASVILGISAQPEAVEALRLQMGLDDPVSARYWRFISGLAVGDFGTSLTYGVPVGSLIFERMQVTAPLAILSMGLAATLGIPMGAYAASRRGRASDALVMGIAQVGVSLPNFWLGLLMILVFSIGLGWLPASGFPGWSPSPGAALRALTLPALALALPQAAIIARVTRSCVLDALGEDYIRTARAKGASPAGALWRHALPNALIPVVTVIGVQFSFLLAGTIVIEFVFVLPGLGNLVFQSISQRDLVTVQAVVTLLAVSAILVNFSMEALYRWLDPRLRLANGPQL